MNKDKFLSSAGVEAQYAPRHIEEILEEIMNGNSPLAIGYRMWKAQREEDAKVEDGQDELFNDIHPNTELCVDLKLLTRAAGRMEIGEMLDGAIVRDGEDHFTFIQNALEWRKVHVTPRNPHVYVGKRINVHRKPSGELYPTFNRPRFYERFTFQDFCREAADELYMVAGLVEE